METPGFLRYGVALFAGGGVENLFQELLNGSGLESLFQGLLDDLGLDDHGRFHGGGRHSDGRFDDGRFGRWRVGNRRFGQLPDVPTIEETVPGYRADIWYGVLAPAATPDAVLSKLNGELVRQLQSAELNARLVADGSEPVGSSSAELAAVMRGDLQRWAKVIKDTGLRAN